MWQWRWNIIIYFISHFDTVSSYLADLYAMLPPSVKFPYLAKMLDAINALFDHMQTKAIEAEYFMT